MAEIQALRAIRFDPSKIASLSDVVAPPYDVITPELQKTLYERHPTNVVRLILNRQEPGDEPDAHYQRAAGFLESWRQQGALMRESVPSVYVYHQEFQLGGRPVTRRSFIARVRLEEFGVGKIYPHEDTHSKAKEDRLRLTRATKSNLSQIFAIFEDPQNVAQETLESAIAGQKALEATDDLGVVHKLWITADPSALATVSAHMAAKSLYIADGHHRYETALRYRSELRERNGLTDEHSANFVSMCCVSMSDPGMLVLPTHRLWRGVAPIDSDTLKRKLASAFECRVSGTGPEHAGALWSQLSNDDQQSQLGFYCAADDTWVSARLSDQGRQMLAEALPEKSDQWRSLGVSILHQLVMARLLGLTELPSPKYVHSVNEVVDGLRQGDQAGRDATGQMGSAGHFNLATLVMPATIDHVRQISELGERMPAKSTYFYPKLLSGLVINSLQD